MRHLLVTLLVVWHLVSDAHAITIECGQVFGTANQSITVDNDLSGLSRCTGHGIRITASGVTIDCQGHEIEGNKTAGKYAVLVESTSSSQFLQNVTIRNCVLKSFNRGVVYRRVNGGAIEDNDIDDMECNPSTDCPIKSQNAPYGVDVTRASTSIMIKRNTVTNSFDEGIHISGKNPTCPKSFSDPGQHVLEDNTVTDSGTEGIYILCSDKNRIIDNDMADNRKIVNNGIGLFIDEWSSENVISGNLFINDPIGVKQNSTRNAFSSNVVIETEDALMSADARIKFSGSSSNFMGDVLVDGQGKTSALYVFEDDEDQEDGTLFSQCNQATSSVGLNPLDDHIEAKGTSKHNRFLRFDFSSTLACSVNATSSVQVTNANGVAQTCGSSAIDPDECTYWYFDELCGVGAVQQNDDSITLSNETINAVRYARANDTTVETGPGLTVSATGCATLSAKDKVVLGPGTTVNGRLRAIVQ